MVMDKSDKNAVKQELRGRISDVSFTLGIPQNQRTRFRLGDEEFSLIGIINLENFDYLKITERVMNHEGDEKVSYDIQKFENGRPEGDVVATYHQDYIRKKILFG